MKCSVTNIIFQLVLLTLGGSIYLSGQDINFEHFEGIKPRNIGPAGMSGRVTAIDVDLSDPNRIYVGTASGGVWLSENGGINWHPIFDKEETQSIGAIKIDQRNPSIIWVGTGEGNPRNSQNSGNGVYKSNDGGKSWMHMGLEETKVIHRIIIDESRDGVVYVGAQGSAWGPSEHRGVFKTLDDGKSWEKVLYVNDQTGIADMVVDPTNPNKIIAALWEFGRTPAFFNSGGEGSGLHITYDGGASWKKVTEEDGLPSGNLGRMGVAIAASNPDVVYALVEAKENALYKSLDGGISWKKHSTHQNIGNRPFYYSEIYVDPTNESRVYSLYTYVSVSIDGGKTFTVIADYGNSVHPDHHAFWIHPTESDYLIDGNDGGLAISRDKGNTWQFVSNLPVGQFYHVNVDNEFPYNVYGGMQDNGSWVGPGFVLKRGGITNHDWREILFGDGFDVAPLPHDADRMYAMSQGGNLALTNKLTGLTYFIKPNHPDSVKLRYNWNAALALEPNNDCGVYYGSQFVHYSQDCGQSWRIISPDLTTNDTSKQHQDISGGLTIDATNAENNTTIVSIAPSQFDKSVIWVGSDDGRLHVTKDQGASWEDIYKKLPDAPKAGWIPQIVASKVNRNEVFVVVNNYRQNDWSPYLYKTSDLGKSWTRIVKDEDVGSFVTSVIQDSQEPNLLFLGTDVGLYISIDGGDTWSKWSNGFPSVQIRDLAIQETFGDLVLGTFGRAFWVMDDIGPFRQLARENFTAKDFDLVSCSQAIHSQGRSYAGIRFVAQGEYQGDNRGTDAVMSIWIKPNDKMNQDDTKTKKNKEKIRFSIVDATGDTVRRFSRTIVDKGLQRMSWNLQTDGVVGPSRRDRQSDDDLPSGGMALPGTYEIIAQYKDLVDKIKVDVTLDPRLNLSENDIKAMRQARKDFEVTTTKAKEAFDKIKTAKSSLSIVEKMASTLQDSIKKDLAESIKDHKKKLQDLENMFFNQQGLKGIQRNPNVLSAHLSTAGRYIRGSHGAPGPNAVYAIQMANEKTDKVVRSVEAYLTEEWSEFKSEVENIEFDIFSIDED